nr:isoleucine--tRNA ligase [Planctomycetota bacterium]
MSDKDKKKGYRDTLNLPKTAFAMKANLTQREPQQRKAWDKVDIYNKILAAREDSPQYLLHDGPPYANGDIHMGHVINKVLKDFVVKYKTMTGHKAPYVPGWDCHGLPIEVKVMAELGEKAKTMSKPEIRKECQKYASKFVKQQTKQFKALGVFGDFKNPYLTLKPQYEQGILEIFAELVGNGLVYKQLKPIHWSIGCETALADAELEYEDITSSSVYVNFPMDDDSAMKVRDMGLAPADSKACFMIWTTTPWTLAANLAVALHPRLDYVGLTYGKDGTKFTSIICAQRLEAVVAAAGLEEGGYSVSDPVKGCEFEKLRYVHPYVPANPTDRDAYFAINAEYITTEDGTGIVHIAPGHGAEDYMEGMRNGLAVYSPVMDNGCYDETVPEWLRGKSVLKVNKEVNEHLRGLGLLVHEADLLHSYPHCWRSKMPVIFRATEQWFVSVDREIEKFGNKSLRNMATEQIKDVKWVPGWGQKRIQGMLESRPDWCISRQRSWGLPIPSFVNSRGDALLTKESVTAAAKHIGQKGSNSWFIDSPKEILGEDFQLPEGFSWDDLTKEENIFDVWFESGCSWHSVMKMAGYDVPVDLYLEGSDQHRGWFQLSLLPALGATGAPPFKTVLTHGFTVDDKGMKQSKSAGNYVSALKEVEKYGADILRLWVSSVNYQEDMRCSDELIGRLQDAYRKIRNTLRYLMSNINGFVPAEMSVDYKDMSLIDQWAMEKLNVLIDEVHQAYDNFGFHRVFNKIYNFCTVEMSSIYMDVLK